VRSGWFARLTTGAKAFLILSIALLPLAVIGVIAVLQTASLAEESARARLRVAAAESGRRLAIELQGDANALRGALSALVIDPADMASCARVTGVFAPQFDAGTRFAVLDRAGRLACGSPVDSRGIRVQDGAMKVAVVPNQGLLMTLGGPGLASARVFFPTAFLEQTSRPGADLDDLQIRLTAGAAGLDLRMLPVAGAFERRQQVSTPIGVDDVVLQLAVPSTPITSSVVVAMLLPLLMWAAAAGMTWFAVDRLFIRPIRQLNANIRAYRPGEVIRAPVGAGAQAVEIRELYDGFVRLSRTVVDHEAELAEGLVRQTKLTREVHHRVKNNLQVIASLINFHARGATVPEAIAAYASIQRRVDALAVVHRNHFAEMEVSRGLGLRSMISELSANIRATAPDSASGLGITLEIAPFLVSQDTAVAVAFLTTELVELAMSCQPAAQIRISARPDAIEGRAIIRVISTALIQSETLESLLTHRYGRVIEGLSRQLRSKLHHDPLAGAYEISIAVLGIE
jgi:two-component sensor histidine kinase